MNLRFGNYVLNPRLRQLTRGGEPLVLSARAFDVLLFMAENAGKPLLKSDLIKAAWPDSFVEESSLTNNIFLLRKAMGPGDDAMILTLPGKGYQFAANVIREPEQEGFEAAVNGERKALPVLQMDPVRRPIVEPTRLRLVADPGVPAPVRAWRSPLVLTLGVLCVAALASAGWLGWQRYQDRVGGAPVQLVVADLDGSTGDPVLDRTLTTVTRTEFAQSPFVSLLPQATVRATLQQMLRKPTDPVTVPVARDVCERTGSQAVLHQTVARVGRGFVLTEEATNCVDGATLAMTHQEAEKADDLPRAIGKAGVVIRHGLGESRRTIERFSAPMVPTNTGSLEALKAYTQASTMAQQGKYAEAIELQKQAIALDPQFAAAYLDLSSLYANSLDPNNARIYVQKAYDLRDQATLPAQLYITARYHEVVTGDLYEGLRNYQSWIAMYPRQPQPWSGLENVYTVLGQPEHAVAAAERLLQLLPGNATAYQGLIVAQMHHGDFAAARQTGQAALAHHFDTDQIHYLLLRLAHLQHDDAALAAEESWGRQHPDSPLFLANQAGYALQDGRLREGEALIARAEETFTQLGTQTAGARLGQQFAASYAGLGDLDEARRLLAAAPLDPNINVMYALMMTGEPEKAAAMLREQLALHPQDTLWNQYYQPLVQGQLALLAGHADEAVKWSERGIPFDNRDADNLYLRGDAYLAAHRVAEAENAYRTLLAHPGGDANAYQRPLAQLHLARVLALEGRRADAMAAYHDFLTQWAHADRDEPLLLAAQRELSSL